MQRKHLLRCVPICVSLCDLDYGSPTTILPTASPLQGSAVTGKTKGLEEGGKEDLPEEIRAPGFKIPKPAAQFQYTAPFQNLH